jgi:hypothetical protein
MKIRWKPSFIGSLTGLALLASFPVIAVAGKLNADEVEQLVSGNTLVFDVQAHGEGGREKTRYYDANGTFRQLNKKGNKTQKGSWSINDKGELCSSRKKSGACHVIYKRGNVWEAYVEAFNPMAGDKLKHTIKKVLKGNPNGL